MKRLVLVGAGHAHIEVLRELGQRRAEGVEVTLVSPFPWFTYSAMVPGLIAGHYEIDELTVDLIPLCNAAGATLVHSAAIRLDAAAREVGCANGATVSYDVLSLDVGLQPSLEGARGADRHAVLVRPLERLVKGWTDVLVRAREGGIGAVTVVGGGAAGVELALAMEHRLRQELGLAWSHVRLIADTPEIVPAFPRAARNAFARKFVRRNIGLHVGHAVTEVGPDYVRLEQGLEFASDAAFWVTGGVAPGWLRDSGLATVDDGFVLTDPFLRSVSHPEVFAAGDCQRSRESPNPPAGVFAVRAAPVLAANLRAALADTALTAFKTSPRFLSLVSTGNRNVVGVWNGLTFEGGWAWRWKDRMDRRFVGRYREPRKA
jgi:pyridine nucleotide-disulfide oxidoreductase family protein